MEKKRIRVVRRTVHIPSEDFALNTNIDRPPSAPPDNVSRRRFPAEGQTGREAVARMLVPLYLVGRRVGINTANGCGHHARRSQQRDS